MDWYVIAAISSTAAVMAGGIVWFFARVVPTVRRWSRKLDQLFGVPENTATGQEHVPGIVERMDGQDEVLQTIRHEVETNTGSSLKDEVNVQGRKLDSIVERLDRHLSTPPDQTTNITFNPPEGPPWQE